MEFFSFLKLLSRLAPRAGRTGESRREAGSSGPQLWVHPHPGSSNPVPFIFCF